MIAVSMMEDLDYKPLHGRRFPDSLDDQLKAVEDDPEVHESKEARRTFASDPHRPLYHFSPPGGHMNDPNGLSQWQGKYHLFYQRRLLVDGVSRVHWGHTFSEDLVHWHDLPLALYPDTEKDCYSGQTLVEQDRVIAIYLGTRSGKAIATASDPLLLNWKKHPKNPVIPMPPPREDGRPYRTFDPCIWKEDDGYYSISGSYWDGGILLDCGAVEHLFRSKDLAEWEYLGPLLEDSFHTEPGEDGAVPNFWPIGNGKHILLVFSHKRAARYYVGDYDPAVHRFKPDYHGRMNYGPAGIGSLHAPSATVDDQGRLLAIFNVKEGKLFEGWNDVMTLPRELSLATDNSLRIEPVKEVECLRTRRMTAEPTLIPANSELHLQAVFGKALEIQTVIDPGTAREVGLYVMRSPDSAERTRISFYRDIPGGRYPKSVLQIDPAEASLRDDVFARTAETGPLALEENEPLRLRIFIDRSIIEVYANDRQCLTLRVYPARDDSRGVSVFSRGADAKLLTLNAWSMHSIWPELRNETI